MTFPPSPRVCCPYCFNRGQKLLSNQNLSSEHNFVWWFLGGRRRNELDTFPCEGHTFSTKRLCCGFLRPKFCISRLKIHRQKTQKERESLKEYSVAFLQTNESFSLRNCPSRNSTLFSSRRSDCGLFWTKRTKASKFLKKFQVHSVLYNQGKYFLKGRFRINRCFIDVLYILTSA